MSSSRNIIVASHLSSLWPPTRITTLQVESIRHDLPLPNLDSPPGLTREHATFCSIFSFSKTGDILLRVIGNGYIIELTALQRAIEPIRIMFQSPVLSKPAVDIWQDVQLRVLVVTENSSLYRMAFAADSQLWHSPRRSARWCQEYRIKNQPENLIGPAHALGSSGVVIGLKGGGLLRVEARKFGDAIHTDDEWVESVLSVGSLLSSLASYIPFHSGSVNEQLVSITSLPYPTDLPYVFTMSANRLLRAWMPKSGCVAQVQVLTPGGPSDSPGNVDTRLLPEQQNLVRVFLSPSENEALGEDVRVLVFSPSPAGFTSPGTFVLYQLTPTKELLQEGLIKCPPSNVRGELVDFLAHHQELCILWRKDDVTTLETSSLIESLSSGVLRTPDEHAHVCRYPRSAEINAIDVESILRESDSLTENLLHSILRPGMFSPASLQAAIQQYTDALSSLPVTQSSHVHKPYSSVEEEIVAVVGSSVQLTADPSSGLPRRRQYLNALKRDWEGFIARCMDIERSARYPLALSFSTQLGIVVVERERTGVITTEDEPMRLQRILTEEDSIATMVPVSLAAGWKLRRIWNARNPDLAKDIAGHFTSLVRQDIAFTYTDVMRDASASWARELDISSVHDIISAEDASCALEPNHLLASICCLRLTEDAVKAEAHNYGDGASLEWEHALANSLTTASISSRYDLAQNISVLLLCLGTQVKAIHNSVIASFFATFRSLSVLNCIANFPTPCLDSHNSPGRTLEEVFDVEAGFNAMRVSSPLLSHSIQKPMKTMSSLMSLVTPSCEAYSSLFDTSQAAFSVSGLLTPDFSSHVTVPEVAFCNDLLTAGFNTVLEACLSFFPNEVAIVWIKALLFLAQGRIDDASRCFKIVGAQLAKVSSVCTEERKALMHVIPELDISDTLFPFYAIVAGLFDTQRQLSHVVSYCKLALEFATPYDQTQDIWKKLIHYSTDLGSYEDAYMAIVECPIDQLKATQVDYLVQAICENDSLQVLVSFSFAGFRDEVESSLKWKARNGDLLSKPSYSHILYAWYLQTGDYRSAALVIFEYGCRLTSFHFANAHLLHAKRLEADACILALNALSIVEPKHAWILVPVARGFVNETTQNRPSTRNVPDDLYSDSTHDHEIVDLAQLRRKVALSNACLELAALETTFSSSDLSLSPGDVVARYADRGRFDTAFSIARLLLVDSTILFERLTDICLRLQKDSSATSELVPLDWLQSPRASMTTGKLSDRAWKYLELMLEQYDNPDSEFMYRKCSMERIVREGGPSALPRSLLNFFLHRDPETLIRSFLKFGYVDAAVQLSSSLIAKAGFRQAAVFNSGPLHQITPVSKDPTSSITRPAWLYWIPYNLFEQIILDSEHQSSGNFRSQVVERIGDIKKTKVVHT